MKEENKPTNLSKISNSSKNNQDSAFENAEVKTEFVETKTEPTLTSNRKDRIKEALTKKYPKGKLRVASLITYIFLVLALSVVVIQLCYFMVNLILFMIDGAEGASRMFNQNDIGGALGSFLFMIYYALLLGGLIGCGSVIAIIIIGFVYAHKLIFLKDEDFMMNIIITKLITQSILPALFVSAVLVFVFPLVTLKQFALTFSILDIASAVILVLSLISFIVQAIVAKSRYKKNTPPEIAKAVIAEKRQLQRLYFRRERSGTVGGRLY